MFSVNIDKLVLMNDSEAAAYKETGDNVMKLLKDRKTLALMGTGAVAFKIAASIYDMGKKVMFIDGDFSSSVFIGKYKLGKNLKGVCEYIAGDNNAHDIICKTNRNGFEIVFTGSVEEKGDSVKPGQIEKLIAEYQAKYDYVIVSVGNSVEVAGTCGGTAIIMSEENYSEEDAKAQTEAMIAQGCRCIGVILENAKK